MRVGRGHGDLGGCRPSPEHWARPFSPVVGWETWERSFGEGVTKLWNRKACWLGPTHITQPSLDIVAPAERTFTVGPNGIMPSFGGTR